MADEKEETKEEGGKKKGKTLIIIIVAVLVVLLAAGGALAFLLLKGGDDSANNAAPAKEKKKGHADDLKVGPMFAIDNMVINLTSETGTRYAKVALALEMDEQELSPEMMNKKAIITDIVINVISSKTAEELMTLKGKEDIKTQITEQVNEKLQDGRVKNVYFTNFIIQ